MKKIFISAFLFIALLCSKSLFYLCVRNQANPSYLDVAASINPHTSNLHTSNDQRYGQYPKLARSIARGKKVYSNLCIQCHLPGGKGVNNTYPPLQQSNWLSDKRTASIHAIKYGLSGLIEVNGKPYNSTMTPLGLLDEEVADVMNYIMNNWGNEQDKMVTKEEVKAVIK